MSTVIADVKNKRLISDRQMSIHSTPVTKVFKVEGYDGKPVLIGGVGNLSTILRFVDWYKAEDPEFPEPDIEGSYMLVMESKGHLVYYAENLMPITITEKLFAIGSGGDYAMGALDAGASPEQALKIASNRDGGTGKGKTEVKL